MKYSNIDDKLAIIVQGELSELYTSAKGIVTITNGRFGRSQSLSIRRIKNGETSLLFLGKYENECLVCNGAYIHYEFLKDKFLMEKSSKEAESEAKNHYERIKTYIHELSLSKE